MGQDLGEKVYSSKESSHYLNPLKVNEIVKALYRYQDMETRKAFDREGSKNVVYITRFTVNKKDYVDISVYKKGNVDFVECVQLAKLNLTGRVHLQIHAYENLIPDPAGLEQIAQQFEIYLN